MKLSSAILLVTVFTVEAASLRGPFSKFKCTLEAWSDEDKCSTTENQEGDPCAYCKITNDGQEAGLCVDPEVTANMEAMNPAVKCNNDFSTVTDIDVDIDVDVTIDYHDFKCSIEGFTDPTKCSLTKIDDGSDWCQYCSMDGPFGEQGVCVSPEHAKKLQKMGAPNLHCKHHMAQQTESKHDMKRSPITDCNLSGIDKDTCLDPTKVNGSDCVWCDAAIGGFCFPQSWSDKAGHFLTCESKQDEDSSSHSKTELASQR